MRLNEQITEIQEKILGIPDDPTNENIENGNETLSKSATLDCNALFSQITTSNGMLVFTDWDHFESVLRCLENQIDACNDAFEAQYGYMSDEEFNATAERLGLLKINL